MDTILQALVTGQAPLADARQQVGDGLNSAAAALSAAFGNVYVDLFVIIDVRMLQCSSFARTSNAEAAAIATAQSAVIGTLAAGIRVIEDCN